MLSIPFPGNKKDAYKFVRKIFVEGGYRNVLEPFGGSCVLSVNLKNDGLADKAVINDYDGLWERYPEYLDAKDGIVRECYRRGVRKRSKDGPKKLTYLIENGKKIPIDTLVLEPWECEILQEEVLKVDRKLWPLLHLGNNFTYPGWHGGGRIEDFKYFDNYLDTKRQRAYLAAVRLCETPSMDWREFYSHYVPRMDADSLLIIDPPYIGTEQKMYKGGFTLKDTWDLMERTVDTGIDFIFFNHDPALVEELLDGLNPAIEALGNRACTATKKRLDVMAYVKRRERPKQLSFMGDYGSSKGAKRR